MEEEFQPHWLCPLRPSSALLSTLPPSLYLVLLFHPCSVLWLLVLHMAITLPSSFLSHEIPRWTLGCLGEEALKQLLSVDKYQRAQDSSFKPSLSASSCLLRSDALLLVKRRRREKRRVFVQLTWTSAEAPYPFSPFVFRQVSCELTFPVGTPQPCVSRIKHAH